MAFPRGKYDKFQDKNNPFRISAPIQTVLLKKDLEGQLQSVESRINEELKDKASKMMSEEDHQGFMKKI